MALGQQAAAASPARSGDRPFQLLLAVMAAAVPVIIGAMLIALIAAAWPAIQRFGAAFFVTSTWDPVRHEFGVLPFVYRQLLAA